MDGIGVWRDMVLPIEGFQLNTVFLGNGIHGLSCLHNMWNMLIALISLATFFLQIDNIAFREDISLVALVVFRKLTVRELELLSNTLERIALSCHNIIIPVVHIHTMLINCIMLLELFGKRSVYSTISTEAVYHCNVVFPLMVETVKTVALNDIYKQLGITDFSPRAQPL